MPTANIDVSQAGDSVIISPTLQASQAIKVHSFFLTSTTAGGAVCKWKSAEGTVLATVGSTSVAGGGAAPPVDPEGMFFTSPGQGLVLNLETAARVTGFVKYDVTP